MNTGEIAGGQQVESIVFNQACTTAMNRAVPKKSPVLNRLFSLICFSLMETKKCQVFSMIPNSLNRNRLVLTSVPNWVLRYRGFFSGKPGFDRFHEGKKASDLDRPVFLL
jgi:hypothetical protein